MAALAAMTTDDIGPGSGVARNYFCLPGDGFGFGYGFGVRTDPGNAMPPPPGRRARSNGMAPPAPTSWSIAHGICFFVVLENAPSGRLHVQVNVKKLIYDAFEK
jgi:hypothetical protein